MSVIQTKLPVNSSILLFLCKFNILFYDVLMTSVLCWHLTHAISKIVISSRGGCYLQVQMQKLRFKVNLFRGSELVIGGVRFVVVLLHIYIF